MNHHVKPMTLIKETDYGTPHPEVTETTKIVTLEIDGLEITVPEGTSIMNAAMQLGIQVPKLCATDSLEAFGSCRLCLCEIEGRKGTPASCTTPVAPGIKVTTQNARLANIRRGVMELYISDHPLDCLTCTAQRRLRTAGHGGRRRPARSALRLRRRQPRFRQERRRDRERPVQA